MGKLPNAEDVAGGIFEVSDPQIAFVVSRLDDGASIRPDLGHHVVDPVDVDVGADASLAGNCKVRPPVADEVTRTVGEARIVAVAGHGPTEHGPVEGRGHGHVFRRQLQVRDGSITKDRYLIATCVLFGHGLIVNTIVATHVTDSASTL